MRIMKYLLAVLASAALTAGCASDRTNAGGTGYSYNSAGGSGNSYVAPVHPRQAPMGPNGSIGPGNPFGAGPGNVDNQ